MANRPRSHAIQRRPNGSATAAVVPLPASLTLIGKALAQVQLSVVHLDPGLDPFEIAGKFLMRSILKSVRSKLDPKTLLYESQKLKVRAMRVIETFERLIGARPGQKLAVNFHATSLEDVVRQTGRRLALGRHERPCVSLQCSPVVKASRCEATKSRTVIGGLPVSSAMILSSPEKMPF
jgi:hypothetical protein